MSMQLSGYLVPQGHFASWCGTGDEAKFETLAESVFEDLSGIDRRLDLPAGSAEAVLRDLVMSGTCDRRASQAVIDAVLASSSPKKRLESNAWSPVKSGALEDLDGALSSAGVARNALLQRLSKAPCDAAGRAIIVPDATLRELPAHGRITAENLWRPALARMKPDDAQRADAILSWWRHTLDLWVASNERVRYEIVLTLR